MYIKWSICLPLPPLILTTFFHSPRIQYSPIYSFSAPRNPTQPNPGSTMAHLRFPLPNGIPHENDPLPIPHPEDDLFLDDGDGGIGVYFVELGIGYEEYQTRRLIFYFCLSLFLSFYTVAFYLFSEPDTIIQFPWVVRYVLNYIILYICYFISLSWILSASFDQYLLSLIWCCCFMII